MEKKLLLIFIVALIGLIAYKTQSQKQVTAEPFQGFMIDAPRGVETMKHYYRLIDFCSEQKMNVIIFRLTDDQGSAFLFQSHPELNMCEGALNAGEMKMLVEYALNKGIEIIPEIESFGHARYIIQTEKYKGLNDGAAGEDFNAISPVNEESLKLMKDLYTEITSIFPSKYLHIGCDEVNWGEGELSKIALQTKSKNQIWAEYVNDLNALVKALGKQSIIWGDVPIYQEKDVIDLLEKDMVIMDWNYWDSDTAKVKHVAHWVMDKGFKLIGCPALNWCQWGPRINGIQFDNINAYAKVYSQLNDSKNLGIIISHWMPNRYLQNSQWDSYTVAAEILKNDGGIKYMDVIPDFVNTHFGAVYDTLWGNAYQTLYQETPQFMCGRFDPERFHAWNSYGDIEKIVEENKMLENAFTEVSQQLKICSDKVTMNQNDFYELQQTVEFMEFVYNRQNELLYFINSNTTSEERIISFLKNLAEKDQVMLNTINSAWSFGRRGSPVPNDPDYMWSFYLAATYSKYLSENPNEFLNFITDIGK